LLQAPWERRYRLTSMADTAHEIYTRLTGREFGSPIAGRTDLGATGAAGVGRSSPTRGGDSHLVVIGRRR